MVRRSSLTRRKFLQRIAAGTVAAPFFAAGRVFGANNRITMGCIGMGGRGRGDMNAALRFDEVRVLAVCDVVGDHCRQAKQMVDSRYNNNDCRMYTDFRDITSRDDIGAVLILDRILDIQVLSPLQVVTDQHLLSGFPAGKDRQQGAPVVDDCISAVQTEAGIAAANQFILIRGRVA